MALDISSTNAVAEGFVKFGPLVWGLSLAIVALAAVSTLLLKAKNQEIRRAEKRVDSLEAKLAEAHLAETAALRSVLPLTEKLALAVTVLGARNRRKSDPEPSSPSVKLLPEVSK